MTKPSAKVRADTMTRDLHRCQAADWSCFGGLQWQHREATGSGGRGRKAPAPTVEDGIILCKHHNADAEGKGQGAALRNGWKIRKFRGKPPIPVTSIPWYDRTADAYYLPEGVTRRPIPHSLALELLELAGNLHVRGQVA